MPLTLSPQDNLPRIIRAAPIGGEAEQEYRQDGRCASSAPTRPSIAPRRKGVIWPW